jgi:hypothetical protein
MLRILSGNLELGVLPFLPPQKCVSTGDISGLSVARSSPGGELGTSSVGGCTPPGFHQGLGLSITKALIIWSTNERVTGRGGVRESVDKCDGHRFGRNAPMRTSACSVPYSEHAAGQRAGTSARISALKQGSSSCRRSPRP